MTMPSWIRNVFARPVTRPIRKAPHRARLGLEALEDRLVPTVAGALPDMLVWLKADGNATDAIGTSDGQLIDDASFASGVSSQAFSLDGAGDYVRVPFVSAMQYTAGYAADAWINPVALPTGSPTGGWEIINQTTELGDPEADYFLMRLMDDGSVLCAVHTSGGNWWKEVRSPAGVVEVGEFTHVAGSFDPGTGELAVYVNGVKTSQTISGSMNAANTTDLKVGADLWNHTYFSGTIDEVGLYNRPLTESEVSTIIAIGGAAKTKTFLEATASSQGTINLGSNGSIVLHLAIATGQLSGTDTVASLFDGVNFTIQIQKADGSVTYGTLNSTAKVESNGTITVSMQMNDALKADLYDAYVNGREVNFNITATANGGNYALDEDTMSRLLNNGAFKYVL